MIEKSINDQKAEIIRRTRQLVAHFPGDLGVFEKALRFGELEVEWLRIDYRSWAVDVYLDTHRVLIYWHPSGQEMSGDNPEWIERTLETLRNAMVLDDLAALS